MSIRKKNLGLLLTSKYIPADRLQNQYPVSALSSAHLMNRMQDAYSDLGGLLDFRHLTAEDLILEFGNFGVVLDEQLQFNRYRLVTLRSGLYQQLTAFPLAKYRIYCRKMENECLKSGKRKPYWTNAEAEAHFGKAMEPGDLGLNGSPGWKMRAWKALLRDALFTELGIRVVHLSIWDELMVGKQLIRLGDLLLNPNERSLDHFMKYFERRLIKTYA
jgi:hypothetical protein